MQHQRRKVEFFTGGRIKGKMPEARLELAQGFNSPTDFKSVASADSATRALQKVLPLELFQKRRSQTGGAGGIKPRHIGFADRCFTTLLPRLVRSFKILYCDICPNPFRKVSGRSRYLWTLPPEQEGDLSGPFSVF